MSMKISTYQPTMRQNSFPDAAEDAVAQSSKHQL
jgi:hypothetical protein